MERGAVTMELKEKPSVLITVTDITERRRTEEALKKSEEKYRAILESASDAILLGDEHGNLIEANRMAEQLLGYTREELLQMRYTQLHPITELDRTVAAFKNIVTNGQGGLQNGAMLRKDGTVMPVDITATAIEYDGRKILQASFRNMSEHKQATDTLERMVRERKRADIALRKKKEELKKGRLDARSEVQVSILEANLKNIISPFTQRLSSMYSGFTPREIQVANLIGQGKSTKDIAEYVGVSQGAINLYRNSIRSKLGIISKKINLRSYLMSLS